MKNQCGEIMQYAITGVCSIKANACKCLQTVLIECTVRGYCLQQSQTGFQGSACSLRKWWTSVNYCKANCKELKIEVILPFDIIICTCTSWYR